MNQTPQDTFYPTIRQAASVLFLTFIATMFFSILGPELDSKYYFIGSRVVFILPMLFFLLSRKFSFRLTLRMRPVSLRIIGLCIVIGLCLSFIGEEFDRVMANIIPLPEEIKALLKSELTAQSAFDWVVMIFGVIMLTALFEEFLFRGFLQTALEAKLDVTRAVMATAFVFSLFYANPISVVQIVIAGVVLGVLAWKSDSFVPSTIAHIMINAVGIAMTKNFLGDLPALNWHGHVHPILLIPTCFVLYFSIVLFYKFVEEDLEISTFLNQPL
ncbi:MAG: lysostaphin resistance A-like protein [bacterium]